VVSKKEGCIEGTKSDTGFLEKEETEGDVGGAWAAIKGCPVKH